MNLQINKTKKIITLLMTLISIVILSSNVFAQFYQRDYIKDEWKYKDYSGETSSSNSENYDANYIYQTDFSVDNYANLVLQSMKMRQNDSYYYFDYVVKIEIPSLKVAPYKESLVRENIREESRGSSGGSTDWEQDYYSITQTDTNQYWIDGGATMFATSVPGNAAMSLNTKVVYKAEEDQEDKSTETSNSGSERKVYDEAYTGSLSMNGKSANWNKKYRETYRYSYRDTETSSKDSTSGNTTDNGDTAYVPTASSDISQTFSTFSIKSLDNCSWSLGTFANENKLYANSAGSSVSTSARRNTNEYYSKTISGTASISKSAIMNNNMRYLKFIDYRAMQTKLKTYKVDSDSAKSSETRSEDASQDIDEEEITYKVVASSNAIDLMDYVHCGATYDVNRTPQYIDTIDKHLWRIGYIEDRNYHNAYCPLCQWTHKYPHNFVYEYDGILNNLCICGFANKVNYVYDYNDDTLASTSETYLSLSPYTPISVSPKEGYTFLHFEKYQKVFPTDEVIYLNDDMTPISTTNRFFYDHTPITEILKAENVSTHTTKTEAYSTRYKAVWKGVYYTVKYSNTNNKGIVLDGNIPDEIIEYGSNRIPPEHIPVADYQFEGWTTVSGSDVVEFTKDDDISKLSTTENDVQILYPIYQPRHYTITLKGEFPDPSDPSSTVPEIRNEYTADNPPTGNLPSPHYDFGEALFWICEEHTNGIPSYTDSIDDYWTYRTYEDIIEYLNNNDLNDADLHFIPYFEKNFKEDFNSGAATYFSKTGTYPNEVYERNRSYQYVYSNPLTGTLPIPTAETSTTFDWWVSDNYTTSKELYLFEDINEILEFHLINYGAYFTPVYGDNGTYNLTFQPHITTTMLTSSAERGNMPDPDGAGGAAGNSSEKSGGGDGGTGGQRVSRGGELDEREMVYNLLQEIIETENGIYIEGEDMSSIEDFLKKYGITDTRINKLLLNANLGAIGAILALLLNNLPYLLAIAILMYGIFYLNNMWLIIIGDDDDDEEEKNKYSKRKKRRK